MVIIDSIEGLDEQAKEILGKLLVKCKIVGIYFVIISQRPSADTVPNLIKINLPTRISFRLPSHFDS